MIDKIEIKKLIENKEFEETFKIFYEDYLEKLKMVLDKKNVKYDENITLIDAIMLVDISIPNSELITHTPMEAIFMETREAESRANYALNWYERWLSNIQNILS